jgi:hypothetical protein
MNILAWNTTPIEAASKQQNGDFVENGINDFDYISVIYGNHRPE